MVIGVTGSRKRTSIEDYKLFLETLKELSDLGYIDYIITGGCPKGADEFAHRTAKELGIPIKICYPSLPPKYSPKYEFTKAYYKRNIQIAQEADLLIAMPPDKENWSGGTGHTMKCFVEYRAGKDGLIIL